jgi:hypothetical protein
VSARRGDTPSTYCGARFRPVPYRGIVYLALVAVLAAALVVGMRQLWQTADEMGRAEAERDANPTPRPPRSTTTSTFPTTIPSTTAPLPVGPLRAVSIEASATAGPAQNACGDTTLYDAQFAQDGDPATTWRVRGDGSGQAVTFTLPSRSRLTEVGVVPGYVKIDPCGSANRFLQMRRLVKVRWLFDAGEVIQELDPDRPEMQTIPVDVVASTVTLEIVEVTGNPVIDFTPVSEVSFVGAPA